MVALFTDGSCLGDGRAGCGYVVSVDGALAEGRGIPLGKATNNVAELGGAIHGLGAALGYLKAGEDLLLVLDSRYVAGGLPRCDVLGSTHGTVNGSLWRGLYDKVRDIGERHCRVLTCWVPGHAGVPGNELCDRLARKAAATQVAQRAEKTDGVIKGQDAAEPVHEARRRRNRRRGKGRAGRRGLPGGVQRDLEGPA